MEKSISHPPFQPKRDDTSSLEVFREPLKTPVGFPEVPRRKSLIPYNIKNYANAIFSKV
jgi:hypothetical protein